MKILILLLLAANGSTGDEFGESEGNKNVLSMIAIDKPVAWISSVSFTFYHLCFKVMMCPYFNQMLS